jgi:hypothetical protein
MESGILKKDRRDLFQNDTSHSTHYRLINTYGFTNNQEPMGVKFNHKVDCIFSVYDLCGRLILQQIHFRTDLLFIEPAHLQKGIYVCQIQPITSTKGFRNFNFHFKVNKL